MATYYINADTGDDTTGDGSQGNPWLTLVAARDNSVSGDTVIIQSATNTYTITTNMNLSGRILIGEDNDTCVLTSNGASIDNGLVASSVENLKFYNIGTPNNYDGVLRANTTNCIFDNVGVGSTGSHRSIWRGGYTVTNCLIYNSPIANLFFLNNGNTSRFYNNVVHKDVSGMGDLISNPSHGTVVDIYWKNNIFYLTNGGVNMERSTVTYNVKEFDYNCIYGSFADLPSGTGNLTNTDPLFIDPANRNYKLSPSSPCIDAGTLV